MSTTRIDIEAPDSTSARRLECRLAPARAKARGRGRRWQVALADAEPADVEAAVRGWLRDVGVPRTTMWVDGWPCTVRARNDDAR